MRKFVLYLLITLGTLFTIDAFCQSNQQDVFYLKNGSVIRGEIVEQVPGKTYKIRTRDRSEIIVNYEDVERIVKEAINNYRPHTTFSIQTSILPGIGDAKGITAFEGLLFLGYQFHPLVNFSLGSGFTSYNTETDFKILGIPLLIKGKLRPMDGNVSPTLSVSGGYFIGINSYQTNTGLSEIKIKNIGGPMFNAALGVDYNLKEKVSVYFDLGYRHLNFKQNISSITKFMGITSSSSNSQTTGFDALAITIGVKLR